MSIEEIRSLKHHAPFQPFSIVMRDGRAVWVAQPERIALSPSGRTVAIYEGNSVAFFALQGMRELRRNAAPPISKKRKAGE